MRVALAFAIVFAATAMAITAQSRADPSDLFKDVRQRVLADLARIPNYTCVETVTRQNMYRQSSRRFALQPTCGEIIRQRDARKRSLPVTSWNRLRLEVAIADENEIYSWVGASTFQEGNVHDLVGYGQTAGGEFGPILAATFVEHAGMRLLGERTEGGRRLLEYGFDTPRELSQWVLKIGSSEFTPPYSGSVLIDPNTGDVVQVTRRTSELPPETGYCQSIHQIRYGRVQIAGSDALIPREARLVTIAQDGSELVNVDSFESCREYEAESVLRFDDAGSPPAVSLQASAPDWLAPIPAGVPFDCRIVTPIDSNTAAAGDPVEAVLRSPIKDPDGVVLVAPGARIHGRLLRFSSTSDSYELGVQFNWIERGSARVPFGAIRKSGPLRAAPGMGIFVFKQPRLRLPQLDSSWITAAPEAAPRQNP